MKIAETIIRDSFAEAFEMRYSRLIVTAIDSYWLETAVREVTGYSSSVIGCDVEAGLDTWLAPGETLDGRPGAALLFFGRSTESLAAALCNRIGQSVMTCPTTAVYDGIAAGDKRLSLGGKLRFFGDGFQKSKILAGDRYWRVPVMDGEFLVADQVGAAKGVAGGNLLFEAKDVTQGLAAARAAAEVVDKLPGVIAPFPGGIVRSGSKVGSRYAKVIASTADAYCPTLRGRVESNIDQHTNCVYEIVIDGIDQPTVEKAMVDAMQAAAATGLNAITAGNYGGKLGPFHFHLRKIASQQTVS